MKVKACVSCLYCNNSENECEFLLQPEFCFNFDINNKFVTNLLTRKEVDHESSQFNRPARPRP